MIAWHNVATVLLDMDGTLLDLYFDSFLWKEHLPGRYAERNGLDVVTAKQELAARIRAREGSLQWYCLDHWTQELHIDIAALEREIAHLISVRPHVLEFLQFLRRRGTQIVLATNAHRRSLEHKLSRTSIRDYFDAVVSSHDFGVPKEAVAFWQHLHTRVAYDPAATLLIDDNPAVLRSARTHGIRHLLAIALPDSHGARRQHTDFVAIDSFLDLLPTERDASAGEVADGVTQS